jgi:hypothetical protein
MHSKCLVSATTPFAKSSIRKLLSSSFRAVSSFLSFGFGEREREKKIALCQTLGSGFRVLGITDLTHHMDGQCCLAWHRFIGKLPIHGNAPAKAYLYRDRLQLLQQRLLRDKHFAKPAFGGQGSHSGSCEVSSRPSSTSLREFLQVLTLQH